MGVVSPGSYAGRYIHYGIREHAMAAAANGMAVHGGLIPYTGTFFIFSDYMRPALRLAALMRQRVIHVLTHDSIGLGEDGPTHQPVEQLASLRAMPNFFVFRPADTLETAAACGVRLRPPRPGEPELRTVPDPFAGEPESFAELMAGWLPLTYMLNNLNRGLGQPDAYPFVLSPPAVEKLGFVHDTIRAARSP